ncbi:FAD-binding domain-containing protein [Daldinia grandis]|nr:FAD-binding domain-containing protein [Daldinia grandis]
MRSHIRVFGLLACIGVCNAGISVSRSIDDDLKGLLSSGATISHDASITPRWSEFHAPQPGTIVSVATEADVEATVQYCLEKNIPFFAQNGGHGWSSSWHLGEDGLMINLRGLNTVVFNSDKTQARIGGGASIQEVIEAAYNNDAQLLTGNCNCVGYLGAGLGGGYGNLMGLYGFSVDNYLSINVVLANGSLVTVDPEHEDLWWALRGAGPNFGVVTSIMSKTTPLPREQNMAWVGGLYFTEDKIEQIVQGIEDLRLEAHMTIFMYFATTGAPDYTPTVLVAVFYYGTEADGRTAFKPILDIGPYKDTTAVLPQNQWNAGADGFCVNGERKPTYAAGFDRMVPSTWRQVWAEFTEFLKNPDTGSTSVIVECYSLDKAQSLASDSASFPNRDVRFNAFIIAWYPDPTLDSTAEALGSKLRDLWRADNDLPTNRTYVNFAYGDEANDVVYHDSTTRLRQLKKQYDPNNILNQWFDLQ